MNWHYRLLVYMMNECMLWYQDDSVEDGSMYACMDGRMDLTVVRVCVCACVRACVRVCVHVCVVCVVCVRACVHARTYMHVCAHTCTCIFQCNASVHSIYSSLFNMHDQLSEKYPYMRPQLRNG